jgi:hypothetical protein
MRLETSERPSSLQLPWGYFFQLQDNNAPLQGPASSATRQDTGQKSALYLAHFQNPVYNVARVDMGRSTVPLGLCKLGQSPIPTQQSEVLTDHLGLAAEDGHGCGTSGPFKITWEELRLTIQVAGRLQSPTWCYLTFQISFIIHKSLWLGWMVPFNSQKRKTVLFKI